MDPVVLEQVAEIFASLPDADTALRKFLALVRDAAGTPWGAVYLRDDARGVFARWREDASTPPLDLPAPLVDSIFAARAHVFLPLREARLAGLAAAEAGLVGGAQATAAFALRHRGLLGGILGLGLAEARPLPEAIMRTLAAVAAFPAAAIEHARTREVNERRARLALLLRQFGERVLSTADVALHRLILETALALTGSAEAAITELIDDRLRVVAAIGKSARYVGETAPVAAFHEALSSTEPHLVPDAAAADPTLLLTRLARDSGTGSFIALPMRHDGRVFGHLFAGAAEPHRLRAEEVEAMRILASMAAAVLEQRSAQAAAAEQARRLDATIEHLPILVEVFGPDGAPVQSNAAARALRRRLGIDRGRADALFGGMRHLALDGRALDPAALPPAVALRGGQPAPQEMLLVDPAGARRATLSVAAAPIRAADGGVEAVVVGCQDVGKLHELAEAKDRFLRVASHELRTPITALRATTQLISLDTAGMANPQRRSALVDRVDRQSARLVRLVDQLLDSARLDAAELPLQRTRVELVALCRDVLDGTIAAEGRRVVLRAAAPVVGVWDPLRIEQVLTNLVSNAVRYGAPDGEVVVQVVEADGRALVSVSDRGIGIPAHQLDQLFVPFFRGANAQRRHGGGLGLGLHIAHQIVRRHGGAIRVRSRENEGSVFTVELPLDAPAG